jgi:Cu-processing system permease protein
MSAVQDVATLTGFSFRGMSRTRWVSIGGLVFAATAAAVSLAGLRSVSALGLAGAGSAIDGLTHLALLLPPLIGMLLGAGSIARDRELGMLALLASQPLRRGHLVLAAFSAALLATWTVVAVGFGTATLMISAVVTSDDLVALAATGVVALLASAAAVAVGVLLSALARSHHQATAAAAALWLVLALGVDLLLVGVAPGLRLGPRGLLVAVVANPLESARILALLVLDERSALGPFGTYLLRSFGRGGAHLLLAGSLLAWIAGPVLLACRITRRRDV